MALEQHIDLSDDLYKGEAKTLTFTVYQPGTTQAQIDAGGAPVQDITGWTVKWDMRTEDGATVATLLKTATVTDGPGGVCVVAIATADTETLPARKYRQTLFRDDAGSEAVLAKGDCWLKENLAT